MRAFAEEVEVEIAERRQEAIGVASLPRCSVAEAEAQAIVARRAHRREERGEQPASLRFQSSPSIALQQALTRHRVGVKRAQSRSTRALHALGMQAEDGVGARVLAASRRARSAERITCAPSRARLGSRTARPAEAEQHERMRGEMQRVAAERASLAGRGPNDLVPAARDVRPRQSELASARSSVDRQEQRIALDRAAALVRLVGGAALDHHAEHVVLRHRPSPLPPSRRRRGATRSRPSRRVELTRAPKKLRRRSTGFERRISTSCRV